MYDALSEDYDRFVNWDERLRAEVPFILRWLPAAKTSIKILDAACGTGRHVLALKARGYDAAGVDFSAPMIAQAKANAKNQQQSVQFEVAALGQVNPVMGTSQYGTVMCLGNSLPHLIDEVALQAAMADFYQLLKPNGVLLIQNRNFDLVMATQQRWMPVSSFKQDGYEWVFLRFYEFNVDGLITFNFVRLKRAPDAAWLIDENRTILYPLKQVRMLSLVKAAGFSEVFCFGNMAGDSFITDQSENLVIVAKK